MRSMPGPSPGKRLRRALHNHDEADRTSFGKSTPGACPVVGNHLAALQHILLPAYRPAVSGVLAGDLPGGLQTLPVTPRSAPAGLVGVSLETSYPRGQPPQQRHTRPACDAVAHAFGSARGSAATTDAGFGTRTGYSTPPVPLAAAFDSGRRCAPATALGRRHGCPQWRLAAAAIDWHADWRVRRPGARLPAPPGRQPLELARAARQAA